MGDFREGYELAVKHIAELVGTYRLANDLWFPESVINQAEKNAIAEVLEQVQRDVSKFMMRVGDESE